MSSRASTDAEDFDHHLAHQWVQVSGPMQLTLHRANTSTPYLRLPQAMVFNPTWTFEVTVTDTSGLSDTDQVVIQSTSKPQQFQGNPLSLAPYRTGQFELTPDEARHFGERATFGMRPEQVNSLIATGLTNWVNTQLNASTSSLTYDAARADGAFGGSGPDSCGKYDLVQRKIQKYANSLLLHDDDAMLKWKDWYRTHTLFATSTASLNGQQRHYRLIHADLIDDHGALTRNYRNFLTRISTDGAMLLWLNGNESTGNTPNENYAREFLELFTLGQYDCVSGVPNYDETDVANLALAFTGWNLSGADACGNSVPTFVQGNHATPLPCPNGGPPGFQLTFAGQTSVCVDLVAGAVDAVMARESARRFLACNLFEYYVGYTPDAALIDELAALLPGPTGASGAVGTWDLQRPIKRILKSNAMFSNKARKVQTRSPLQMAMGHMRKLDMQANNTPMANRLQDLGHALLAPPSVKGWPSPTSEEWIGQARLIGYMAFANEVVTKNTEANSTPDLSQFYPDYPASPLSDDAASFAYQFARAWGIASEDITLGQMQAWVDYLNTNQTPPVFAGYSFDLNNPAHIKEKGMGFAWMIAHTSVQEAL